MTTAISTRVYRRLLAFYPDDLRRDFGPLALSDLRLVAGDAGVRIAVGATAD